MTGTRAPLHLGGPLGALGLGCVGGAVALTAVLGGPSIQAAGYGFAIWPIAVSSLLLLGAALAFNHLMPRAAKMA